MEKNQQTATTVGRYGRGLQTRIMSCASHKSPRFHRHGVDKLDFAQCATFVHHRSRKSLTKVSEVQNEAVGGDFTVSEYSLIIGEMSSGEPICNPCFIPRCKAAYARDGISRFVVWSLTNPIKVADNDVRRLANGYARSLREQRSVYVEIK